MSARGTAALLAVLALSLLTGSGCSGKDTPSASAGGTGGAETRSPAPVAKVRVAPALPSEGNETSFQTFLEAEREAELVAETDGEIVSLRVREGQRVAAGDTLLVIDDRDERLELRRDEALSYLVPLGVGTCDVDPSRSADAEVLAEVTRSGVLG